jgi:hypothetical protein
VGAYDGSSALDILYLIHRAKTSPQINYDDINSRSQPIKDGENPHTIIITLQSLLNNPFLYSLHSHSSNEAVKVTTDKKKDLPSTTREVIWNRKD